MRTYTHLLHRFTGESRLLSFNNAELGSVGSRGQENAKKEEVSKEVHQQLGQLDEKVEKNLNELRAKEYQEILTEWLESELTTRGLGTTLPPGQRFSLTVMPNERPNALNVTISYQRPGEVRTITMTPTFADSSLMINGEWCAVSRGGPEGMLELTRTGFLSRLRTDGNDSQAELFNYVEDLAADIRSANRAAAIGNRIGAAFGAVGNQKINFQTASELLGKGIVAAAGALGGAIGLRGNRTEEEEPLPPQTGPGSIPPQKRTPPGGSIN